VSDHIDPLRPMGFGITSRKAPWSYGPTLATSFGVSASHVDRILRGERPCRPSGQAPTKYELAIDLKIAKDRGWDHEESCRPVGR